jgi:hypothetical protein
MGTEQRKMAEGFLIALLSSGRAVFVKVIPFLKKWGSTSIAIFDPINELDFIFDISNVRIEKRMEDEKE